MHYKSRYMWKKNTPNHIWIHLKKFPDCNKFSRNYSMITLNYIYDDVFMCSYFIAHLLKRYRKCYNHFICIYSLLTHPCTYRHNKKASNESLTENGNITGRPNTPLDIYDREFPERIFLTRVRF